SSVKPFPKKYLILNELCKIKVLKPFFEKNPELKYGKLLAARQTILNKAARKGLPELPKLKFCCDIAEKRKIFLHTTEFDHEMFFPYYVFLLRENKRFQKYVEAYSPHINGISYCWLNLKLFFNKKEFYQ